MLEDLKLGPEYDGFLFLAESVRNPPVLRPHQHVELELNLVVRGRITYVVDGRRVSFDQGCLLWMFPEQEHQLVDRTPDAAYYVAVFKPAMIADACRGPRYRGLRQARRRQTHVLHTDLEANTFDLLRAMMETLVTDGLDPDVLNREAGFGVNSEFRFTHNDPSWLNAGLRHLLLHCWRLQMAKATAPREVALHPAVARALARLAEPDEGEDLAQLARRCGVTGSHLSRLFREQVGVTLSRYRSSVRLGRFWEVLARQDEANVLDAALEAGFGSYAQFFRVFREAYGHGPREFLADPLRRQASVRSRKAASRSE